MAEYYGMRVADLKDLSNKRRLDSRGLKLKHELVSVLVDADDTLDDDDEPARARSPKVEHHVPSPIAKELSDLLRYKIDIGLDYGTSKFTATYMFSCDDKRISPEEPLTFGKGSHEVPMEATWIDKELVHGWDLHDREQDDPTLTDLILNFWKLSLYPDSQKAARKQDIEGILRGFGKTFDDLLCEHLVAVWRDIRAAVKATTYKTQFSLADFDDILKRARVRLTVPQMWGLAARRRMQAAAKKAGMNIVILFYEPQCALAYIIHKEAQKQVGNERQLRKGSKILVADLGCGTGDFVMYMLKDDLGLNSKLELIGDSRGALCGSLAVDELLLGVLLTRKGSDWQCKTMKKLHLTEHGFRRRALMAIEKIKRRDGGPEPIYGFGEDAHEMIILTRGEVEAATESVLGTIKKHLNKLAKANIPDILAVTGGFSKSPYLMASLTKSATAHGFGIIFPHNTFGECYPVAMGALLQYGSISRSTKNLPSEFAFAYLTREHFVKESHPDAWRYRIPGQDDDDSGSEDEHYSVIRLPCVHKSFHDPKLRVVDDRIRTIIRKGQNIQDGEIISQEHKLEFFLSVETPKISATFVYMDENHKDQAPAKKYDLNTDTYDYLPGIYHWASPEISIDPAKLQNQDFETQEVDGENFWVILAQVVVVYQGEDLRIGFDILRKRPPTDDGVDDEYEVVFREMETVWQAVHSEFLE